MGNVRLTMLTAVCMAVLAAAGPAASHIGVTPGLLVAGDTQMLSLSVHNDLDRPMTGLSVMAPTGVQILRAGGNWEAVIENGVATWSGEPLAANTGASFELDLAVDSSAPVGPLQLQAEQLYPEGGSLPWPIPVTVVPGTGAAEASSDATYVLALALIGVIVLASIGAVAWLKRRRGRPLQEQ